MHKPSFFERKIALLPAYLLSTVIGYCLGYHFLFTEFETFNFKEHLETLLIMPLMQIFAAFASFFALIKSSFDDISPLFPLFSFVGLGSLVFGILFLKRQGWSFLILFSISIVLLSIGGWLYILE